jgi:GNAT superfamily N-acetyltransferase
VKKASENSLTFGVYCVDQQIGYARIISDFASFAYLADVYVLEAHRGQGLSKWLMETIHTHPELQGLRRWMLATRDAHGLYAQFGWKPLNNPDIVMEIYNPNIYTQQKA